jgi:hypothetical protein
MTICIGRKGVYTVSDSAKNNCESMSQTELESSAVHDCEIQTRNQTNVTDASIPYA